MDVRESLLKATVKVFAEAGARGATTRRIAQEAGVNEVTLFRHFKSKDDLLECALRTLAELAADRKLPDIPADPVAELTEWARDHHRMLHKYRALIRKTMGEFEENPSLCACTCSATIKMTSDLADYLKTLQLRGLAHPGFNTHAAAAMLMGALFADAISRDAMPDRFPYSMKESVDLAMPLFFQAIGLTTRKKS
ncbi:MAG: TetR/AcrR family transcriptional regulator [Acidobacteria bacterium]|nr:MAG: TetR/AcrR family transcriptional regulator [Acidobacteriota bacterium]